MTIVQEHGWENRLACCRAKLENILTNAVLMICEAYFHLNGTINKYNYRYCAENNFCRLRERLYVVHMLLLRRCCKSWCLWPILFWGWRPIPLQRILLSMWTLVTTFFSNLNSMNLETRKCGFKKMGPLPTQLEIAHTAWKNINGCFERTVSMALERTGQRNLSISPIVIFFLWCHLNAMFTDIGYEPLMNWRLYDKKQLIILPQLQSDAKLQI